MRELFPPLFLSHGRPIAVADQPALYGLLGKIRNLSLALLSVNCVEVAGP